MKNRKVVLISAVVGIVVVVLMVGISVLRNTRRTAHAEIDMPRTVVDRIEEIRTALPLFHRVDPNYSRGSEPAHGGIETLAKLGVRDVVDLRSQYDHTAEIQIAAERAGLTYHWMPLSVWNPPTDEQTNEFISLVTDKSKGPFFVFCADGLHRTGEMTAIYRLVNHNWKVGSALKEMDEVGFNPYYYSLRNYVWSYARKFRPGSLEPDSRSAR